MSVFVRYLLAMIVHTMWQRAGGKGAVPPIRVPTGKGKHLPLPALTPWQLIIASWALRKLWGLYGGHVKHRMTGSNNATTRHVGTLLPDPTGKTSGKTGFTTVLPQGKLLSKLRRSQNGGAKPATP